MSTITRYEKALPPEQWQQILTYAPAGDLCNVALTSRYMNSVASWPDLWEEMRVNAEKVRQEGLAPFYSINRFKKITKIDLQKAMDFSKSQLDRLLNDVPGSPLESVNLTLVHLSRVPAEQLANAVSGLRSANLQYTSMTTDQCVHVLEANLSSRKLVDLNLGRVKLSQVPSELLADTVSSLKTVGLGHTNLTNDQCVKVLEAILSSRTLVSAELDLLDFTGVPALLLGRSVSRLQTVDLGTATLTTDQYIEVLEACISSETLVHVNMWKAKLTQVPTKLLAKAVSCLQTVNLGATKLTTDQCRQLLEVCLSTKTLVKVGLTWTNIAEQVPVELLASLPPHVSL